MEKIRQTKQDYEQLSIITNGGNGAGDVDTIFLIKAYQLGIPLVLTWQITG